MRITTLMMITMAAAAFMLAAGNAQARLGWTIDDCQNMWGAPTKVQLVPALNETCFTFPAQSNLFVQVYLLDDMVQDINYVSRSKAFLLKNANQFLQTNVSGLWKVYDDGRGKETLNSWQYTDPDQGVIAYAIFWSKPDADGFYKLQIATDLWSDSVSGSSAANQGPSSGNLHI